ncbi:hypothetical protein ColKHC_03101 [Colletotrichum higginsianum]|nr:hypothetical protein ColKHC_03101 [Colletotrichum higginsianum]
MWHMCEAGIVAAVHEDGSRLHLVRERVALVRVLGPNAGRQAKLAVIHELDSLVVTLDALDGDDGPKRLLRHDRHGVVDAGQQRGLNEVALGRRVVEGLVGGGCVGGALGDGVLDVRLDRLLGPLRDDGPDVRALVERVSQLVPLENLLDGRNKGVVDLVGHVHALDRAAALARVEDGAVDDLGRGPVDVDVVADVGRVLAAELEPDVDDAVRRRLLHCEAAGHGASESDELHLGVADDGLDHDGGAAMEVLQHASWEAGRLKHLGHVLDDQNEDRTNGDLADEALEALLRLAVGVLEHLIADLEEVLAALHRGGDLDAGVGNGAAHLDGELLGELILLLEQKIQRLLDDGLAVGQGGLAPRLEGLGGGVGKLI